MKQLSIPYLPLLNEADLERASLLVEDMGCHGSIESVNWSKMYGYMPITFFYVACSKERLYIKYNVHGNALRAVNCVDQAPVCQDSCVEFFCRVPGDSQYYNFEFNCIGACYAAKRAERHRKVMLTADELSQIERLSSIENKPFNEIDGLFCWSLMVTIPFSLLGMDGQALPEYIDANFNKCADETSLRHYVSWNPIVSDKPDFHRPECFGRLFLPKF